MTTKQKELRELKKYLLRDYKNEKSHMSARGEVDLCMLLEEISTLISKREYKNSDCFIARKGFEEEFERITELLDLFSVIETSGWNRDDNTRTYYSAGRDRFYRYLTEYLEQCCGLDYDPEDFWREHLDIVHF